MNGKLSCTSVWNRRFVARRCCDLGTARKCRSHRNHSRPRRSRNFKETPAVCFHFLYLINDGFHQLLQFWSVEIDAADDSFGIDDDGFRSSPDKLNTRTVSLEKNRGRSHSANPVCALQDLLRLRKVLFGLLEIAGVNVDQNHCQPIRSESLLGPLDQREAFDADVSGETPDVENERLAGQRLETDFVAVGSLV